MVVEVWMRKGHGCPLLLLWTLDYVQFLWSWARLWHHGPLIVVFPLPRSVEASSSTCRSVWEPLLQRTRRRMAILAVGRESGNVASKADRQSWQFTLIMHVDPQLWFLKCSHFSGLHSSCFLSSLLSEPHTPFITMVNFACSPTFFFFGGGTGVWTQGLTLTCLGRCSNLVLFCF
jgi:hypothetical protein